jgi:hypothetical protein
MRTTRDWRRARATHNEVLETLEAVIARHPTNVARTVTPGGEPASIPDGPLAPVVDLRARRELARAAARASFGAPDDAA